jgi:Fur family iron response transcriptional regulator
MARKESSEDARDLLRAHGLRPTRQRVALANVLFPKPGHKQHVTAEALFAQATKAKVGVSLATVYNTLHQFTDAGLLREVSVPTAASHFDTNTTPHYHVLDEDTGMLTDLKPGRLALRGVPRAPRGSEVTSVDVVVRMRKKLM